jgi:hypothetical protein
MLKLFFYNYILKLLSLLCFLIILFLLINYKKNTFNNIDYDNLSPAEIESIANEKIKINKDNYNEYIKYKKMLPKRIKFGYGEEPNVNKKTLGICPLGYYFDGIYNNPTDILKKCKKCFKCNKKPGYYFKSGCLGDKDSVCEYGLLPHDYFVKIHKKPYIFHNQAPQHRHKYDYSQSPSYEDGFYENEYKFKLSSIIHNHL